MRSVNVIFKPWVGNVVFVLVLCRLVFSASVYADAGQKNPTPQANAVQDVVTLLTQEDQIAERITAKDLSDYIRQVDRVCLDYFGQSSDGLQRDAGVAFALRSGGQSRFWLVYRPERTLSAADRAMLTRLQAISAPSVLKGTVIVAITYKIHGGQPEKGDKWIPMPKEWSIVAADNGWKLSTESIVDRLWPEGTSKE